MESSRKIDALREQGADSLADRALQPDWHQRALYAGGTSGCEGFDQVRIRSRSGRPRDARPRLLPAERRQAQADPRTVRRARREDAGPGGRQERRDRSQDILALETALATVQWTKVENRDPIKTYNKVESPSSSSWLPAITGRPISSDSGVKGKDGLPRRPPAELHRRLRQDSASRRRCRTGRRIFAGACSAHFAPYLSKAFVDEHFAFYGSALRGVPSRTSRAGSAASS